MSALSDRLVGHLTDLQAALQLRSLTEPEEGARRKFEQQVLATEDAHWIVLADVASFYEYVDHAALRREILEWTGDVPLADATSDLLSEVMARQFGLPQGPRASDVLADLYLSYVDRRLTRMGLAAHRFNDDFMLSAPTAGAGERALATLERTLRERGLAMNHAKGRIVDRETFASWVEELQKKIDEARFALAGGGFYEFDPERFAGIELEEGDVDTAERVFAEALDADRTTDPYFVSDRLLQKALPILAAGGNPVPLFRLNELIPEWSAHARLISLYLRSFIGRRVERIVVHQLAQILPQPDLSPWVRGWLLDPLARGRAPLNDVLTERLQRWVMDDSQPWFVRGRAAIALAQREVVSTQKELGRIFEAAPEPARADLLAAALIAAPPWVDDAKAQWAGPDPMLQAVVGVFESGTIEPGALV